MQYRPYANDTTTWKFRNMMSETLRDEGYAVANAYSGTEALMLLAQSKPDLILLDLMLPGLSGEDLLPKCP